MRQSDAATREENKIAMAHMIIRATTRRGVMRRPRLRTEKISGSKPVPGVGSFGLRFQRARASVRGTLVSQKAVSVLQDMARPSFRQSCPSRSGRLVRIMRPLGVLPRPWV
jgi:hypothetical protein